MRDVAIRGYKRRYGLMGSLAGVALVGSWIIYGAWGFRWWMPCIFAMDVIIFVLTVFMQTTVRCPECGRLVSTREDGEVGQPIVFICSRCDVRLVTNVPAPYVE
jgi:hypothetical protein